ncbi:unnamed protein product, partial [Mesorhabditis spiculigera]
MDEDTGFATLQAFIGTLRADPSKLHHPRLGFFRDYLVDLGATLPPKPAEPKPAEAKKPAKSAKEPEAKKPAKSAKKPKAKKPAKSAKEPEAKKPAEDPKSAKEPEAAKEDDIEEIPEPELDLSGVIEPDPKGELPVGDHRSQLSDEESEKFEAAKAKGMQAFSEGNFNDAIEHFTEALLINASAILLARRAFALIKINRPNAAIADCSNAIDINPDSAQGYKYRGRAYRLLGNFRKAHQDLVTACKLDYDDQANEWLKEVEPNVGTFSFF